MSIITVRTQAFSREGGEGSETHQQMLSKIEESAVTGAIRQLLEELLSDARSYNQDS